MPSATAMFHEPLPSHETARGVMGSTLRCLAVLELLATPPFDYGLTQIAQVLGLAKATARRFLATLEAAGYVERDADQRRYRLASKSLVVGTAYLRRSPVYRAAYLHMQELARVAEVMVHLAVKEGDSVLFLCTVGQPGAVYLYADIGERRPVHATAMGKLLLALGPQAEAQRVLSGHLERFTRYTMTDPKVLAQELEMIRQKGYAVMYREIYEQLGAVAAPVRDSSGQAVAAICADVNADQLTPESELHYARILLETALRISAQLGYRPANPDLTILTTLGEPFLPRRLDGVPISRQPSLTSKKISSR
ncbi:MAG: IclR family transcriptional regulator [Bryobacteraceae bacterium]|nr:IclR family transcriptional regulator [Bryobacteraceae bacterium]MDW8377086.1 IclR family transcriptional regulator [Bryobacterales bacterium]